MGRPERLRIGFLPVVNVKNRRLTSGSTAKLHIKQRTRSGQTYRIAAPSQGWGKPRGLPSGWIVC
jgi:hypothetical protein